jgi:hypothetical protein
MSIVAVQMRAVKGCPMSALGQKQTYAVHKGMSALPPRATSKCGKMETAILVPLGINSRSSSKRFGPNSTPD